MWDGISLIIYEEDIWNPNLNYFRTILRVIMASQRHSCHGPSIGSPWHTDNLLTAHRPAPHGRHYCHTSVCYMNDCCHRPTSYVSWNICKWQIVLSKADMRSWRWEWAESVLFSRLHRSDPDELPTSGSCLSSLRHSCSNWLYRAIVGCKSPRCMCTSWDSLGPLPSI